MEKKLESFCKGCLSYEMCAFLHRGELCGKANLAKSVFEDLTNIIDDAYLDTVKKAETELASTTVAGSSLMCDVYKCLAMYREYLLNKLEQDVYE